MKLSKDSVTRNFLRKVDVSKATETQYCRYTFGLVSNHKFRKNTVFVQVELRVSIG